MIKLKRLCFECKSTFYCNGICERRELIEHNASCICKKCGKIFEETNKSVYFNFEQYKCNQTFPEAREVVKFT
jgi:hypothetical protein